MAEVQRADLTFEKLTEIFTALSAHSQRTNHLEELNRVREKYYSKQLLYLFEQAEVGGKDLLELEAIIKSINEEFRLLTVEIDDETGNAVDEELGIKSLA